MRCNKSKYTHPSNSVTSLASKPMSNVVLASRLTIDLFVGWCRCDPSCTSRRGAGWYRGTAKSATGLATVTDTSSDQHAKARTEACWQYMAGVCIPAA